MPQVTSEGPQPTNFWPPRIAHIIWWYKVLAIMQKQYNQIWLLTFQDYCQNIVNAIWHTKPKVVQDWKQSWLLLWTYTSKCSPLTQSYNCVSIEGCAYYWLSFWRNGRCLSQKVFAGGMLAQKTPSMHYCFKKSWLFWIFEVGQN